MNATLEENLVKIEALLPTLPATTDADESDFREAVTQLCQQVRAMAPRQEKEFFVTPRPFPG